MGLLDSQYAPDQLAQGLLGLGSALMTPRQLGGGLMAGANAFNQGAMQAQMMRRQMAQDAMRAKLLDAKVAEIQEAGEMRRSAAASADEERRRKAEQDAARQQFWSMMQGGPQAVAAQTGSLAPANANAALLGRSPQITPAIAAQAAALGIPLDTLRGISESGDWGVPKVARVETIAGPDGSPQKVMLDDRGRRIGDAMPEAVKREMLNTGGAFTPVNPFTQTKPLAIGMSAAERDASARGWSANALARQRLDFDRQQAAGDTSPEQANLVARFGKPPKDFRWAVDGSGRAEPIPGGPADPTVKDPKQVQRASDAVNRADIVIRKVDDALKKAGFMTTGATGAALGLLPGTNAYDLRADAETIRANIGFQELQAMREASPTGGALGQVAVQELNALQSVVGNLDANQSERQLRANLTAVRKHFNNWKRAMQGQMPDGAPETQPDPLGVRAGAADPLGIRR